MFAAGAGGNAKELEYWVKQGVHWMQVTTDYALMLQRGQEIVNLVRQFSAQGQPAGAKG
jgi:hypothetical protein